MFAPLAPNIVPRNNLIVISDLKDNAERLRELVGRFDSDTFENMTGKVYKVEHGLVEDVATELQSILERHGVARIESLGKPFNPEFHQAMMEVEDPSVPSGTVVQELIPGYLIAGRLLRASMVAVSKGGPTARAPSNEN